MPGRALRFQAIQKVAGEFLNPGYSNRRELAVEDGQAGWQEIGRDCWDLITNLPCSVADISSISCSASASCRKMASAQGWVRSAVHRQAAVRVAYP